MRRLASVALMLTLGACGSHTVPVAQPTTPVTTPSPAPRKGVAVSCGSGPVLITELPSGVRRTGSFKRLRSIRGHLRVRGATWRDGHQTLLVGAVCGVRSVGQFATMVSRSSLRSYHGKPALRWTTRGGMTNFMWLDRPGTAVYIGATPALALDVDRIAAGIVTSATPVEKP